MRHGLLLAASLALSGFIVGSVFNPAPHTGGDNAGYIALAHGLLTGGTYSDVFDPERLPHTKYPPVFPGLLAILIALGARTWVALKTTAAVSTVAAVGFTFLWAGRKTDDLGAFAVSLVFALAVGVVYYSQWVLSDPLFVALTMGSLYALTRSESAAGNGPQGIWLALGVIGVGLAYFTRSAGLPLVIAVLAWLSLRRRWRALAAAATLLGIPMAAWALRGRGEGVAQYASEFWMVNPYDPSLGTVDAAGLIGRFGANVLSYGTRFLPLGVVGDIGPLLPLAGVLLSVAAALGWWRHLRDDPGPAELVLPLYAGLVFLWPPVWSGDRFVLPVLPLILVYGLASWRSLGARLPAPVWRGLGVVALLALLVPAGIDWRRSVARSSACPSEVVHQDPWACYGPGIRSFMAAASWSGVALPDGAAVLSRKPRHFYLQSGVPSRAFAFFEDPERHLELSDRLDARYVLLDRWDGFAGRYVASAVQRRPGAFCFIGAFGSPEQGGAQLLGVLPPDERIASAPDPTGASVVRCPAEYADPSASSKPYASSSSSGRIPLLDALDS